MEDEIMQKLSSRDVSDAKEGLSEFHKKYAQSFSFPEYTSAAKKKLLDLILDHVVSNPSLRVTCLEAVRILSRDKTDLENVFTKEIVAKLISYAGLVSKEEELLNQSNEDQDSKFTVEAQKVLCNLIYNSSSIQRECCSNNCMEGIMLRLRTYKDPNVPHEVKFFDMRMLFLLTALCADIRPRLRTDLHGLIYLMEVLDLVLKNNTERIARHAHQTGSKRRFNKRSKKGKNDKAEIGYVPCLDSNEIDLLCEVLKVLFNLTVNIEKYNLEEEEEAHYMRLMSILHDILLCDAKSPEKKEELQSHTVDLLTNMPSASFEELLTPIIDIPGGAKESVVSYDGMNMEAVEVLLQFLERRLTRPNKTYKELLAPILTALGEAARSNSFIRKFLRSKVLPPLRDVMSRPEEGSTLRNRLVKLMTSPHTDVKELVADFLFVLCKESVQRLIKYTGYGNAAGLLANRGLMLGGRGDGTYSSDSADSDTEEYLEYKDRINPVVGCYQEPGPNPMEGMTEEQKEYEAMKLVNMMDKMARDGLVQPMRVGDDGKPHAVSHILELQEGILSGKVPKNRHENNNGDKSD